MQIRREFNKHPMNVNQKRTKTAITNRIYLLKCKERAGDNSALLSGPSSSSVHLVLPPPPSLSSNMAVHAGEEKDEKKEHPSWSSSSSSPSSNNKRKAQQEYEDQMEDDNEDEEEKKQSAPIMISTPTRPEVKEILRAVVEWNPSLYRHRYQYKVRWNNATEAWVEELFFKDQSRKLVDYWSRHVGQRLPGIPIDYLP